MTEAVAIDALRPAGRHHRPQCGSSQQAIHFGAQGVITGGRSSARQ